MAVLTLGVFRLVGFVRGGLLVLVFWPPRGSCGCFLIRAWRSRTSALRVEFVDVEEEARVTLERASVLAPVASRPLLSLVRAPSWFRDVFLLPILVRLLCVPFLLTLCVRAPPRLAFVQRSRPCGTTDRVDTWMYGKLTQGMQVPEEHRAAAVHIPAPAHHLWAHRRAHLQAPPAPLGLCA